MNFPSELETLIRARYPILYVVTSEEMRVQNLVIEIAKRWQTRTAALKAQQQDSPGQRPGFDAPNNPCPVRAQQFPRDPCVALSGREDFLKPLTQGVALGYHLAGFQPRHAVESHRQDAYATT